MRIIISLIIALLSISQDGLAYNRDSASEYIQDWAVDPNNTQHNGWNSDYNFYGNPQGRGADCANFVSQVLRSGCYSQEIDNSGMGDNRGGIPSCEDLDNFLTTGDRSDHNELTRINGRFAAPPNDLEVGDVIIWGSPQTGQSHHAVVVASVTTNQQGAITRIGYAAHTNPHDNATLYNNGNWRGISTYPELNIYHINPSPSQDPHPDDRPGEGRVISTTGREGDEVFAPPTIIVVAHDPNAKYGKQGMVNPGEILEYTIEFENEGEGIAYGVYITDILDKDFDDSSLWVGDVKRIDENGNETEANFAYRYDPKTRMITVFVDNGGEVLSKNGGKFNIRVPVRADATEGMVIENYATVYFPSVPEETKTNAIVSVVPYETRMLLESPSVQYSDSIILQASITTTTGEKPVPYGEVKFAWEKGNQTTRTDKQGNCFGYFDEDISPGTYAATSIFAGDGFYYLPATDTKGIKVLKENTSISLLSSDIKEEGTSNITIKMVDDDESEILHQEDEPKIIYLEYYNDGWQTIKQGTLTGKEINFEFTLPVLTNPITLRARFQGDTRYNSCSEIITLESSTIKVFPEQGEAGQEVTLEGSGFGTNSIIYIDFGTHLTIATTTSNEFGTFQTTFILDKQSQGTKTIRARDAYGNYAITIFKLINILIFAPNNNNAFAYPNPWRGEGDIYFANVSEGSTIKIYTIAGEEIDRIDVTKNPQRWDVKSKRIASGIYIYCITGKGGKKIGKIGVIK
ncbi:MAG: amidase domain-containing protein [bacterium]